QYLNTFTSTAEIEAQLRNLDGQIKQLQQQSLASQTARQNALLEVQQQLQQLDQKIQDSSRITSPYNGCVLELTATPGQVVSPGSPLAKLQVDQPHQSLEAIAYFPVGDGKRIRPGMVAQVVPSSVKREQFGGIVGTVTAVSALPRSPEGIAQVVGNRQLAEQLTAKGPPIEVRVRLKSAPETPTGYAWTSSRGPETLAITSGMTTSTWITLERQAPITFVLPILRQQLGLD
ncbi:MAG: NHLP bacteriocin system secretion protein, partial [Thermosynechococcaceae cyanobacterium]